MQDLNLRLSACKADAHSTELIARLVRLAGLEPETLASAGRRSIHLGYKRVLDSPHAKGKSLLLPKKSAGGEI